MSRRHKHSIRCLEVRGNLIYCNVKHDVVEIEEPSPKQRGPMVMHPSNYRFGPRAPRKTIYEEAGMPPDPSTAPFIISFIDPSGKSVLLYADSADLAEAIARAQLTWGVKQVNVIDRAALAVQTYTANPGKKPWTKLPKGWTEASLQSMAEKLLTGPHPISRCVEKIGPHVKTPEAFCATLARRTGRDRR